MRRIAKLERIRFCVENLTRRAALVYADEVAIHLLPKVGYQWMSKGESDEIITPGGNQKRYPAGALDYLSGRVISCIGERKTIGLFLALLRALDAAYPATAYSQLYVVDNFGIHKTKAVAE